MLGSRIIHAVKEPLHNCINAAYRRRICRIRNRELHVSSAILNSDRGKQVQPNLEIANLFEKEGEIPVEKVIETNRITNNVPISLRENTFNFDANRKRNGYLNNISSYYKHVSQHVKQEVFRISFDKQLGAENENKLSSFVCKISVSWPTERTFTGRDATERCAADQAAHKCLQWLIHERRIYKNRPIIYSPAEYKQLLLNPVNINIDQSILPEIEQLMDRFDNVVKEQIEFGLHSSQSLNMTEKMDIIDEIFQVKHKTITKSPIRSFRPNITHLQAEQINNNLLLNLCNRYTEGLDLPIFKSRDAIISALDNERVLLIKGHTGCGKSTQVPQFIMDSFIERLQGTSCHMIISQPRKIAAISLAQRVAAERMVSLGDTVGYQVRLDEVQLKRQFGMQFCTIGIMLTYIAKNPDLAGISHVILDEVHERESNLDLALILLKRALTRNPSLKLILMSASMNTELFQNYFNCPVIDVPGALYPVEMNFLDDISKISTNFKEHVNNREGLFCANMVADLILWIDKNQPPGAILCFLPGWSEICAVERLLKEHLNMNQYWVLSLHSMLPHSLQCKVFETPPAHVRKIILATDIAETSITIKDVVYVVDSAIAKVQFVVGDTSVFGLRVEPISKSSLLQRKGRAGRVQSGVSYHLLTRKEYDMLPESAIPEILRTPLEGQVLHTKQFTDMLAIDFFKGFPEPPKEESVSQAVQNLTQFGALGVNEQLTPLGTRLLNISVPPMFAKALIYSAIFECMSPMVTLSTSYTTEEVFQFYLMGKGFVRDEKRKHHEFSDHVGMYKIIEAYMNYFRTSQMDDAQDYCYSVRLNPNRMEELYMMVRLHMNEMKHARMIEHEGDFKDTYASCDELVCGLLLAATDHLAVHVPAVEKNRRVANLRTRDGKKALIAPVSVNFNRSIFPSPYVVSFNHVHCSRRRCTMICDTSIITPVTVLLFTNGDLQKSQIDAHKSLIDDGMVVLRDPKNECVNLSMQSREADLLLRMRAAIRQILNYYVHVQGHELIAINEDVAEFKSDLLKVLCKLLNTASAKMKEEAKK